MNIYFLINLSGGLSGLVYNNISPNVVLFIIPLSNSSVTSLFPYLSNISNINTVKLIQGINNDYNDIQIIEITKDNKTIGNAYVYWAKNTDRGI